MKIYTETTDTDNYTRPARKGSNTELQTIVTIGNKRAAEITITSDKMVIWYNNNVIDVVAHNERGIK